jgi:hypothetical protein
MNGRVEVDMQRSNPRLTDDISDDGDLAMLAELWPAAVAIIVAELRTVPLAECNDYCRRMAQQILDELGPHVDEWGTGFCRSIMAWVDQRRLSVKQIETLHYVARNAARRALAAERRACRFLASITPANSLPL